MVRDTVRQIERGVRSKSKHYDQDERSERASTEKADHSEQANQTPQQAEALVARNRAQTVLLATWAKTALWWLGATGASVRGAC